ncbi:MAG: hypothetical protein H6574_11855 [Lewinellaceae bacterium]|nr:hypothetical protein [Saprospiraceae bacterium]MCB9331771.1 hypothetical protein [Lewinellaceae bacterium]
MALDLHDQFLEALERKYGTRDLLTSKFGTSSFGDIAKDLCISASQFSKLISGTATQGMYMRSIENIALLEKLDTLEAEKRQLESGTNQLNETLRQTRSGINKAVRNKVLLYGLLTFLAGSVLTYFFAMDGKLGRFEKAEILEHPLARYFDRDFNTPYDSPYLNESEVQDYCPCSAYEGVWALEAEYKLPLPGNKRPGVYYLAKSSDVRMKCAKSQKNITGKGIHLLGYEYLINEIWVDTEETPLSPTYFDKETKTFTEAYHQLDFSTNPKFKKLATIHSFFINNFTIRPDSIIRNGEPCGRFATDVDWALAKEFGVDPKYVLENVLADLTITDCNTIPNPFCDPNELKEGKSVIGFDCYYTIKTENLGIGRGYPYRKAFKLIKQNYSDNLLCGCK